MNKESKNQNNNEVYELDFSEIKDSENTHDKSDTPTVTPMLFCC